MKKLSFTKISLMVLIFLLSIFVIMLSFNINFEYVALTIVIVQILLIIFVKSKYFKIWLKKMYEHELNNKEILENGRNKNRKRNNTI